MFRFLQQRLERPKWKEIKDTSENDEDSTDGLLDLSQSTKNNKRTWSLLYLLIGLNVIWSLVNITVSWRQHSPSRDLNHNLRLISTPSPLFDSVGLGPKTQRVSGGLHEDGIIYRGNPSPEVDEAWSHLSMDGYEFINVTRADIIAAGDDPDKAERWDPTDVDVYIGEVEVAHKIHCLNMVRKEIWGDHYFGNLSIRADDEALAKGEYDTSDEGLWDEKMKPTIKGQRRMRRQHTTHCLHILLQDLMCNADVGIVTVNWKQGQQKRARPILMENFSAQKQCRDFDAVLDWVHENAVEGGAERYAKLVYHPGTSSEIVITEDSYLPEMGPSHHH